MIYFFIIITIIWHLRLAPVPRPTEEPVTLRPIPPRPCVPTPCGPNSVCQEVAGQAQCGCQANMIGSAPNCRPECSLNSDCPSNRACVNNRCVDPCPGSCALNAICQVVNHSPVCSCLSGFSGNGFTECRPIPAVGKTRLVCSIFRCWSLVYGRLVETNLMMMVPWIWLLLLLFTSE